MSTVTVYNQSSDPPAPNAGFLTFFFKTDGFIYGKDSNSLVQLLSAISAYGIRNPVRVASTANVASLSGLLTIDGITLVAGDRVLLKDQTSGIDNGIYVVAAGAWTRATDFMSVSVIKSGMLIPVSDGTTQGGQVWKLSTLDPITVATTSLTFSQLGGSPTGAVGGTDVTGTYPSALQVISASGQFAFKGTTAVSVTADQNDWAVFSTNLSVAHATPTALRNITGFSGGTDGRIIFLHNDSGANSLVLSHEDSGSSAANRIKTATSAGVSLQGGATAILVYSAADTRWILVSTNWVATSAFSGLMHFNDKAKLDNVVLSRVVIPAVSTDDPNNSDWAVNAIATLQADSLKAGLITAALDDTTEQGRGFEYPWPTGATQCVITLWVRAQTAPGATRTAGPKLYKRVIGKLNGSVAVGSWESTVLSDISFTTNTNWFGVQRTITTTTFTTTIAAGDLLQFELTRINPAGGTELVGNMNLKAIILEFS